MHDQLQHTAAWMMYQSPYQAGLPTNTCTYLLLNSTGKNSQQVQQPYKSPGNLMKKWIPDAGVAHIHGWMDGCFQLILCDKRPPQPYICKCKLRSKQTIVLRPERRTGKQAACTQFQQHQRQETMQNLAKGENKIAGQHWVSIFPLKHR
jgi:hypothetical protein